MHKYLRPPHTPEELTHCRVTLALPCGDQNIHRPQTQVTNLLNKHPQHHITLDNHTTAQQITHPTITLQVVMQTLGNN